MKKYEKPSMMLVQLQEEDVICESACQTNLCFGYDCPNCPTICTGIYHCEVFKCTSY